jgi:hypothetical protein
VKPPLSSPPQESNPRYFDRQVPVNATGITGWGEKTNSL